MASLNVSGFVTAMVSVLVGVVILGALITVFGTFSVGETIQNADAIEALIGIIPLICAVGLLLGAIFYFLRK